MQLIARQRRLERRGRRIRLFGNSRIDDADDKIGVLLKVSVEGELLGTPVQGPSPTAPSHLST